MLFTFRMRPQGRCAREIKLSFLRMQLLNPSHVPWDLDEPVGLQQSFIALLQTGSYRIVFNAF